jgi:hypothetical protein
MVTARLSTQRAMIVRNRQLRYYHFVDFGKKHLTNSIIILLSLGMPLIWSCAGGSFAVVDNELERNSYAESVKMLEKNRKTLYKRGDKILYLLDKGMLQHYARQYPESSQLLQEGEKAIEDAFTRSVTQEISTYLINDNVRDYGGEDYEDIYINVFNALNYYNRGDTEGAMVEIRRMNNKLRYLSVKYDAAITGLQKKALEDGAPLPNQNDKTQFSNSALARYLGMLFHRGAGQYDDARIDMEWLLAAFANSPSVYTNDIPESVSGETEIPKGMARLNVLAFGGLSPIKSENVTRIPLPDLRWIKIALPEMVSRHSEIQNIELDLDNGQKVRLELLEDMDAVAKETFKARRQLIYVKSILRAAVKTVSSSATGAAAKETDDGIAGLILGLYSIFAQAFAEVSEQADLRVSRYFPAKAYVAGINLLPGRYSFNIKYYNKNGKEIASIRYEDMNISENTLNLAQAVCLK